MIELGQRAFGYFSHCRHGYIDQHHALKSEDEVRWLLDNGEVTAADLQSVQIRPSVPARFEEMRAFHKPTLPTPSDGASQSF